MSAREFESAEIVTTIESGSDAFDVLSVLGRGGMGVVYKARQRSLDRIVAIKLIHRHWLANPSVMTRLRIEAKTSAALDHVNVVKVFSLGTTAANQPFLVMEYVQGQTLAELLKQGPLSIDSFASIFTQILSALECAHANHFLHRDIKPANILITSSGTGKLMDFGLVKVLQEDPQSSAQKTTQTGAVMGTPFYMSPEQCQSKPLDERSDLYSLGCVMFEAIAGKPPFDGENVLDVMFKHLHGATPQFSVPVSAALQALIYKAMSRNPSDRFSSAAEMKAALEEADAATATKKPLAHGRSAKSLSKKTKTIFLLSAAALVVGVLGVRLAPDLLRNHVDPNSVPAPGPSTVKSLSDARNQADRLLKTISSNGQAKQRIFDEALDWLSAGFKFGSSLHPRDFIETIELVACMDDPPKQLQALEIARVQAKKLYGINSAPYASTLLYAGCVQANAGDLTSAREKVSEAGRTFAQCANGQASSSHATAVFKLGSYDAAEHKYEDALRRFREAAEESTKAGDPSLTATVYQSEGDLYWQTLHNKRQAAEFYSKALDLLQPMAQLGNTSAAAVIAGLEAKMKALAND